MFKKTLLAYIFLFSIFLITMLSCNITRSNCGPFDDKFKTVDFSTDLKSISISDTPNLDIQYRTLESDTIGFDKFGLTMFPIGEYYSLNSGYLHSFSFVSSAFACSPAIPVSEEIIADIQIISNQNFNSEYTSGDNLADLFDIVVLYRDTGYRQDNLNDFLSSEPNVPDEIILILKSAPEITDPIQFTVRYTQNGIDLDSYEFTTEAVVITN